MRPYVKVIEVTDPCTSAYEAAKAVIQEDVQGKKVLLKPNTGFDGPAKTGLTTHPELVRGVVKYFKEGGASQIIVGDSSVIGINSLEALKNSGIYDVCQEEGVICMDLNDSGPIEKKIPGGYLIDSVLLSNILYEVDITVSLPVMKTHMHTGATLSIKNMKGGMYKREKNKLHRMSRPVPEGRNERSLDYGILDLTQVLYPDYAITDGIIGMEGFGPSGGTSKPFGYITASSEPVACDMISMKLMDLTLEDVGHVNLVAEAKGLTYDSIQVEPDSYEEWHQHFQTPAEARLNLSCDNLEYIDESACSACHATLTQFLRYHGDKFQDSERISIFAGKDIDEAVIKDRVPAAYLVGNCTARFRQLAPFCKGCPPVTSEILKMVLNMYGVTVNNLGSGTLLLQTMNYRLLINPMAVTKAIDDIKPTHICLTISDDAVYDAGLMLAAKYNAELYLSPSLDLRQTDGVSQIQGTEDTPIKTEFGHVLFTGFSENEIVVYIENMTLAISDRWHEEIPSDRDLMIVAAKTNKEVKIITPADGSQQILSEGKAFTFSTQQGQAGVVENAAIGFKGVL